MSQELILDQKTMDEKNTARLLYIIHGCCIVFTLGVLSIVPAIFNYVKRPDTQGTIVYSHHSWMIRSFWWYVVWIALGWVIMIFSLGLLFFISYAIWGLAWLWKIYRVVRGFADLNSNKAMP
jgi:uncharacterized membrane protein